MRYPADTAYFQYDGLVRRTLMANADSQIYFEYDAPARTEHVHDATLNKHLYCAYDQVGSRATMSGPEGAAKGEGMTAREGSSGCV